MGFISFSSSKRISTGISQEREEFKKIQYTFCVHVHVTIRNIVISLGMNFSCDRQFCCNVGLADTMTQVMSNSSIEWRDEDSSGTMAAGWNKDDDSKMLASRTPTIPLSQWGPINESSWGSKVQVSNN